MNYTTLDPSDCDFYEVSQVGELPNGARLFVEINDFYLVVFNIAGQVYAIEDLCSHDDGPLGDGDLEDHEIVCPRHGARFDVRSGKALTLPAVEDISAYPVRVAGGKIEVGIPKD